MERHEVDSAVRSAIGMHHDEPNGNCAQSVACALCQRVGIDRDQAFRAMEGFGGGMGGFTETCGAISGAVYVLSQMSSTGIDERSSKADTYALCSQLVQDFKSQAGSTLCCDLRSPDPAKTKAICDGYIERAVRLAAEKL